ncbi:hypothetical protein GUJ93_ZPchr0003g16829 [Zizania palustris]|uniref:Uncharacterized protein n=1 Tax=Zizania palustris TaxID=103762 RepID=A0A8J5RRA0_ZIZPA|nr:hypothetical protein GUJ93_ZPchr0003g16829 [Zizania palustris]
MAEISHLAGQLRDTFSSFLTRSNRIQYLTELLRGGAVEKSRAQQKLHAYTGTNPRVASSPTPTAGRWARNDAVAAPPPFPPPFAIAGGGLSFASRS